MDGKHSKHSAKLFKNEKNSVYTREVEKHLSKDATKNSVIKNLKEHSPEYLTNSQPIFPLFKPINNTNRNRCLGYFTNYLGKNNLSHDASNILEQCNQNNFLKQDSKMLGMGSIGILQDEDSISMEENTFSMRQSQQLPFHINPIYCYNSKENLNGTKLTKQDDKQDSSESLSGSILNLFKNLPGGCSPLSNQRNSDNDSVQNNDKQSSSKPQQPKMPIHPSKIENSRKNDDQSQISNERFGALGKEGLQKLNRQRELKKLNKKQSQQPINAMSPIEKHQQEPGKDDKQVDRITQGPMPSAEYNSKKPNDVKLDDSLEQPKSELEKSGLRKEPGSTNKESNDLSKLDQKKPDKPVKEDGKVEKPTQDLPQKRPDKPIKEEGKVEKPTQDLPQKRPDKPLKEDGKVEKPPQDLPQKRADKPIKEEGKVEKPTQDLPQKRPDKPIKEDGKVEKPTQDLSQKRPDKPIKEDGKVEKPTQDLSQKRPDKPIKEDGKVEKPTQDLSQKRPDKPIKEDGKTEKPTRDLLQQKPDKPIKEDGKVEKPTQDLSQKRPDKPIKEDGKVEKPTQDLSQKRPDKPIKEDGKVEKPTQDLSQKRPDKPIKEDGKVEKPTQDLSQKRPDKPFKEDGKVEKPTQDLSQKRPDKPIKEDGKVEKPTQDLSQKRPDKPFKEDGKVEKPTQDLSQKRPDKPIKEDGKVEKPTQDLSQKRSDKPIKEDGKVEKPTRDLSQKRPDKPIKEDGKVEKPTQDLSQKRPDKPIKEDGKVEKPTQDLSQKRPDKVIKEDGKVQKPIQDLSQKRPDKPIKKDTAKGRQPDALPQAVGKEIPVMKKDGTINSKQGPKPLFGVESPTAVPHIDSPKISKNELVKPIAQSAPGGTNEEEKSDQEGSRKAKHVDSDQGFPYNPEVLREKLKHQIKMLHALLPVRRNESKGEEGFYTDSEFDDMDDEIYETVMSYGAGPNHKMSLTSESSLSLASISTLSLSSSSNVVKDLFSVLRKRSKTELNRSVRPVKKKKDRPVDPSGKTTTIGEAQYVDYENTAFDLNLPTKFKVSSKEVEGTLLMNFDPERKAMAGDKCFRLYKEPEDGHQISIPTNDQQIPVFIYETDNDPEGILVTDQVIRTKLQVCLEVASMYDDHMSAKRGKLLVHLAENAPNSVIGFLRQLAEAVVNRRINSKAKINGFLNKVHEMSSGDRTILKKDLGDKPELDNFRLLSRLKTKVFSEFYRRVGYWELVEGETEVSHKHLFLIRHMPRLYKTGLYPFIDFISEYIANNQIRTLDQLEVALIRFLVCSDGVITKSEFNTFCDFGLKKTLK